MNLKLNLLFGSIVKISYLSGEGLSRKFQGAKLTMPVDSEYDICNYQS